MEFALFGQEKMMLSTAGYDDEFTNIMIGEAIRMRALYFPRQFMEEDNSKNYYQITQSKYTKSNVKFEKISQPSN